MEPKELEALAAHYRAIDGMGGAASRCSMRIPEGLDGKRVLDVLCRKGKGAFALSDSTGEHGYVLGVDPCAGNVELARGKAASNHWAGARWKSYLGFSRGFPEDLSVAGVRDASFDVVYINAALNRVFSLPVALAEFARVLAPGGFLWVAEGVFRQDAGDGLALDGEGPSAAARPVGAAAGESVIAAAFDPVLSNAPTKQALERLCLQAGFSSVAFEEGPGACADAADPSASMPGHVVSTACIRK